MKPERFQYIKGLFEFERLGREEQEELIEEVERLQSQARALATLRAAAQPVIEQADLDAAISPERYNLASKRIYEVILTKEEVEALRAALASAAK